MDASLPAVAAIEDALRRGTLTLERRLVEASNASFRAAAVHTGVRIDCVYKPIAGERPLADFPDGTLARREVATYLVSEATGWRIVPPTVLRGEGPHGPGMAQLWVAVDERADVAALVARGDARLRPIAILDAIVNNTDRKGGHVLVAPSGQVHGVDHGVTFSAYPKLRTVLWGWRGQPFSPDELAVLRKVRSGLDGKLGAALAALLDPIEVAATVERTEHLILTRTFPQPSRGWPPVPWPPF